MNIDGGAGTAVYRFSGDLNELAFLRYDVTNLAYAIPGLQSGAVIGVGGGRDLLAARLFGVSEVVGVEINPIFIDLLTRRFANYTAIARVPGISFEVDEARSWFARTKPLLRHHPDEPDRHLGGHGRRCLHPVGERPLHGRGLADLPRAPDARRCLHREPLVCPRRGQRDRPHGEPRHRNAPGPRGGGPEETPLHGGFGPGGDPCHVALAPVGPGPGGAPAGRGHLRVHHPAERPGTGRLAAAREHRLGARSQRSRAGHRGLLPRPEPADRRSPVLLQSVAARSPVSIRMSSLWPRGRASMGAI